MQRVALLMGRQGSGKTTRVCRELKRRFEFRLRWQQYLPAPFRVEIRENYFNHIARDNTGRITLVSGIAHGRNTYPVEKLTTSGRIVIELPHSGYIPPNCNDLLNHSRLETRAFVIMLPEQTWRSYEGDVGVITSPDFFMEHGVRQAERTSVNYLDDCEQIRSSILASGVPFEIHPSADQTIDSIIRFLGL